MKVIEDDSNIYCINLDRINYVTTEDCFNYQHNYYVIKVYFTETPLVLHFKDKYKRDRVLEEFAI